MLARTRLLNFHPNARVVGVLLVALIVTSAALAKRAVEPAVETAVPLGDELAGLVVPDDVSSVTAPVSVTVAEVMVTVGDDLQKGKPIAKIDVTEGQRDLDQLKIEVDRARQDTVDRERFVALLQESIERLVAETDAPAQLALAEREAQQVPMRQLRDSPERAQLSLEQAQLKAQRMERLAAQGLVPQQDVDEAQYAVRIAADDVANARQAADAAKRVHDAQAEQARSRRALSLSEQQRQLAEQQASLQQARFGLRAAQLRYDTARDVIADPYVRAPRAGSVMELFVHPGDRLTPGVVVAKMAPLDPMAIDINVPPMIANALKVNDLGRVDVPAIRLSGREARVRSISPLPGDDGQYAVRLSLPNPTRERLAGQTAHVRLMTSAQRTRR